MTKNLISIIDQYHEINNRLPSQIVLLVDGPKTIKGLEDKIKILKEEYLDIDFIQIAIKKGDSKSSLIAAAANIAKLSRDKYMAELALDHNDYGWANNAGYGTRRHYEAIEKYGITKEHRKSYMKEIV